MPHICCVKGCKNLSTNKNLRFFSIPKIRTNEGRDAENITKKRLHLWIKAINRDHITVDTFKKHQVVCSVHFISGRPAYQHDESNPDWVPSLHMGPGSPKVNKRSIQYTIKEGMDSYTHLELKMQFKKPHLDGKMQPSFPYPSAENVMKGLQTKHEVGQRKMKELKTGKREIRPKIVPMPIPESEIRQKTVRMPICQTDQPPSWLLTVPPPTTCLVVENVDQSVQTNAVKMVDAEQQTVSKMLGLPDVEFDTPEVGESLVEDTSVSGSKSLDMGEEKGAAENSVFDMTCDMFGESLDKATNTSVGVSMSTQTDLHGWRVLVVRETEPVITEVYDNKKQCTVMLPTVAFKTTIKPPSSSPDDRVSSLLCDFEDGVIMPGQPEFAPFSMPPSLMTEDEIIEECSKMSIYCLKTNALENPVMAKLLNGDESSQQLFYCDVCRACFFTEEERQEHSRSHVGQTSFKCSKCKKVFPSSEEVIAHMKVVHEKKLLLERLYTCKICCHVALTLSKFKLHAHEHTGRLPYVCEYCGKGFNREHALNVHVRYHRNERPFACGTCGKRFTSRHTMVKHEITHSGERPFECNVCGYRFTAKASVTTHMRIHTGERPYACPYCEKTFCSLASKNSHVMTHTGEKLLKCELCLKRYTSKKGLLKHREIDHSIEELGKEI